MLEEAVPNKDGAHDVAVPRKLGPTSVVDINSPEPSTQVRTRVCQSSELNGVSTPLQEGGPVWMDNYYTSQRGVQNHNQLKYI